MPTRCRVLAFDDMKDTTTHGRVRDLSLVLALALVWGYVGLNRTGIGFLLPPIVDDLHLEFWQASLLISGTSATGPLNRWAQRESRLLGSRLNFTT